MSEHPPSAVPGILSELFAVVLYSDHGGGVRVRWSPADRTWLRSSSYGPGFVVQDPPHKVGSGDMEMMTWIDAPSAEDLAAAVESAKSLKKSGWCAHCGHSNLSLHVILPDIYGDVMVACVLRPDPTIVDSYGGNGRTKHLGSTLACRSVRSTPIVRPGSYTEVGVYLYGEPLTIIEALDRPWCSKCSGTAHNVKANLSAVMATKLEREPAETELRNALMKDEMLRARGDQIRYILDEIGDRNRAQLLRDMRAGMRGLSVEDYAAANDY